MKKLIVLPALAVLAFSCDDGNPYKDAYDHGFTPAEASTELLFENNIETNEVDQAAFKFEVSLKKAVKFDVKVNVVLDKSSTAIPDENFTYPKQLIIEAGETSVEGTIQIYDDCASYEDQEIKLTIADATFKNVNIAPTPVNIKVINNRTNVVKMTFDWSGETSIDINGTAVKFEKADLADFDFLIDGQDHDASTGKNPEVLTIDPAELGDGMHVVQAVNYSYEEEFNGVNIMGTGMTFPVNISWITCGNNEAYDGSSAFSEYTIETPEKTVKPIYNVEVENGVITSITPAN